MPSKTPDSATRPQDRLVISAIRRDPDREDQKRPLDFGLIRRLMGYMQPYATRRNWLVAMVICRAIQLPAVAWMIGAVINGPIASQASAASVLAGAGALFLLCLSTQVVFHFRQRLALELGEAVLHDLHNAIFRHLQRMPLSFFNKTRMGRIISRMTSDCEALRVGVQDVLFVSLVGAGQMLVSAVVMAYYDWVLFSAIAAMTPFVWLLNRAFHHRLSRVYRDVQESMSRVTGTLAESVNGIRVTQGFVRQELNGALFDDLLADHSQVVLQAARTTGAFLPLLEFNSQAFLSALLIIGGYRVLSPEAPMEPGDLIRFFFLANIFFNPIQILGNQYNQALTAMAGAERVFKLLDTPPEWTDPPDAVPLPRVQGRVQFEQLDFGYDPARLVLHDVNFTAEAGQTIALVGHTGSGKTSIVNLIAKFYLPTAGRVLVDGHDLNDVQSDSLHRQLGIVQQNNFLFTGTICENVRTGRPRATDSEVRQALATLDCLDLFEALPNGLQTQVGERGASLSLGQRQLVCFARAMLADPRILILDEATSSVDTLTEIRIQQALSRLVAHRTSFIVAHRLSTIRHADLVLVLDNGRIVERGRHDQLLTQNGVYADLCREFDRGSA